MKPQEFQNLLRKCGVESGNVGVAVSGGSDSMALLIMAQKVLGKIVAITVDHGFRKDSAMEAKLVGERIKHLNIKHVIATIKVNITTRIEETLREKRYFELNRIAREYNLQHILLGHQVNDQIETVFFRMNKRTQLKGFAGMKMQSSSPYIFDVMDTKLNYARPFLFEPKQRLENICKNNNVEWIMDPMNVDETFTRVSIRNCLSKIHDKRLQLNSLGKFVENLGSYRETLDKKVKKLSNEVVIYDEECGICFVNVKKYISNKTLSTELFRHCCNFVNPKNKINLELIRHNIMQNKCYSSSGIYIHTPIENNYFLFLRGVPCKEEQQPKNIYLDSYLIFDNRFKIKIQKNNNKNSDLFYKTLGFKLQNIDLQVRFFNYKDHDFLGKLFKKSMNHPALKSYRRSYFEFKNYLPMVGRLGLPCITAQGQLAVVPSMGINFIPELQVKVERLK